MNAPIREVIDVHAAYGRIEVLRGVDLVVPKGAVMALRKVEGNSGRDSSALTRRTEWVQPTKLIDTAVLRMHLLGANPEPKIAGPIHQIPRLAVKRHNARGFWLVQTLTVCLYSLRFA